MTKMTQINSDLIDRLAGLTSADPSYAIRHQREKLALATQGSYDALFDPSLADLSLSERLLVALYVCQLTSAVELAAHYRDQLLTAPVFGALNPQVAALVRGGKALSKDAVTEQRLHAIFHFARVLIENPIDGDKRLLHSLPAAGLTTPAIVALAQLIAFLSYQTRLLAGLRAMKQLAAQSHVAAVGGAECTP